MQTEKLRHPSNVITLHFQFSKAFNINILIQHLSAMEGWVIYWQNNGHRLWHSSESRKGFLNLVMIMCVCVCVYDVPGGSDGKESTCNAGDLGSIPGSGRFPGEGNGNLLQYSCLGILWTEVPGGPQSMGSQRVGHDWQGLTLSLHTHTSYIGSTREGQLCGLSSWRGWGIPNFCFLNSWEYNQHSQEISTHLIWSLEEMVGLLSEFW